MVAGGTHSPTCGALWHTVVARHQAWLRIAARSRINAIREPHVRQLLQQSRAIGLPQTQTSPPAPRMRSSPVCTCLGLQTPQPPTSPTPPPPRPCLLPSMAPRLLTHLSLPPQQRDPPLGTWPLPGGSAAVALSATAGTAVANAKDDAARTCSRGSRAHMRNCNARAEGAACRVLSQDAAVYADGCGLISTGGSCGAAEGGLIALTASSLSGESAARVAAFA